MSDDTVFHMPRVAYSNNNFSCSTKSNYSTLRFLGKKYWTNKPRF